MTNVGKRVITIVIILVLLLPLVLSFNTGKKVEVENTITDSITNGVAETNESNNSGGYDYPIEYIITLSSGVKIFTTTMEEIQGAIGDDVGPNICYNYSEAIPGEIKGQLCVYMDNEIENTEKVLKCFSQEEVTSLGENQFCATAITKKTDLKCIKFFNLEKGDEDIICSKDYTVEHLDPNM